MTGKTLAEIAGEVGVSKQAVYKRIKNEPLSSGLQGLIDTVDGRMIVSPDGEMLIKSAFINAHQTETESANVREHQAGSVDTQVIDILQDTIATLRNQLAVKDRQIEELWSMVRQFTRNIRTAVLERVEDE